VESVIFDLARSDHRYAPEAYEFICETVTYTQERLGKLVDIDDDEAEVDRHVCGEELLRGGCELAVREFGLMATLVFQRWGILNTDDFGEIVFRLIRAGRLSQSEDDDPSDFHDNFDLMQALSEGYDFDTSAYAPRKAER
jgi:uncharacterized repeat protein (TIGR04138 family)